MHNSIETCASGSSISWADAPMTKLSACGSRPGLMGRMGRWTCGDRRRKDGWMDGGGGGRSAYEWVFEVEDRRPALAWSTPLRPCRVSADPAGFTGRAYDRRERAWPEVGLTGVCATCRSLIYCLKCHYTRPFVPEWRLQALRDLWGRDVGWVSPTSSFIV